MSSILTILLLEDSHDDAELVEHELEQSELSYRIVSATNESEYRAALQSAEPDAVLADYNIPGLNGERALEICLEVLPSVPFILVSGTIGEELAVELMKAGAKDFVSKLNLSRLIPSLERALREVETERERVKAQQELEEQFHFLEELREAIPVPLFVKDSARRFIACNQPFLELFGVKQEEVVGHTAAECFSDFGALVGFIDDTDRQILNRPETILREYGVTDRNGAWHDLSYTKAPFYHKDESLGGIIGVVLDITSQKSSARLLETTLDHQRALISSIDQVVLHIDPADRTIKSANPAVSSVFGYEPDLILDQSTALLHVDQEHFEAFGRLSEQALEQSGVFHGEFPLKRRDGSSFTAEVTVRELHPQHGWRAGLVSVINDISERKAAEAELTRKQQELETLLENAPDIIIRSDRQMRVLYVNSSIERIAGLKPEELIGNGVDKTLRTLGVDEETLQQLLRARDAAFETKDARTTEFSFTVNGSPVWLQSRLVPELNTDGSAETILAILRDVTEQKRTEQSLRENEQLLRHAQRMESIGQLAGGVAHDFNNILTVMNGYLAMAKQETPADASTHSFLSHIQQAADRAARLTQQLLLFSRRAPSDKSVLDCNALISGMMKMLDRLIGESVTIETALDERLESLYGDAGKLEQVIMNLVINARDAMPDGGSVTISTRNVSRDAAAEEQHSGEAQRDFLEISVSDSGIGMDEETRERIFEPFFTTKGKEKGTGLGLAVVYGIVEEHDGWIEVKSEPGEGTTFYTYWPASGGAAPEAVPEQKADPWRSGSGEQILVVEDDRTILEIVTSGLEAAGYLVSSAQTLADAQRLWIEQREELSAAIVDVILPDGSGLALLDFAQQLASEDSDETGESRPNIVFASGYLDDKDEFERVRRQGYRLIQKPYSMESLLEEIAAMLGQEPSSSS